MPAPEGFDFEKDGMIVSDSDIACYCRPEHGNHILIGSEDPECDPHDWVEDDTDYNRDFTDQWTLQAQRYGQRVPSLGIPGRTTKVRPPRGPTPSATALSPGQLELDQGRPNPPL